MLGNELLDLLINSDAISVSMFVKASYPKGHVVGDSDGFSSMVAFIEEGTLDVYSISRDDAEVLISTLGKQSVFGISNLFEEEQRHTAVRCRTSCVLLGLEKDILRKAILDDPQAMLAYAKLCNRKIQFLIKRIEQLTLSSARSKVAEHLLSNTSVEQPIISLVSKESLSRALGISRASLFRELAALESAGAISSRGSSIEVIERDILETILQK